MLELIIFPALLGLGLAMDYMSTQDEPEAEEPTLVTLDSETANFIGTDAMEHVTGNALDNAISGGAGNDVLGGNEGNDTLDGGTDNDRLFGGEGDDVALGGAGNDKIFLGDGNDTTQAPDGSYADAGDDFIRGGANADTIIDTQGSNQIFGDLGPDRIITVDGLNPDGTIDAPAEGNTPDTVHAGYGNDTLIGDDGDVMTGGGGDDSFVVLTTFQNPAAPAVLTDFDLRDDTFSVVFVDGAPEDPTINLVFDPVNNLLRASVGGHEIATLSGMTAADIPFIRTYVTTLPELMAA